MRRGNAALVSRFENRRKDGPTAGLMIRRARWPADSHGDPSHSARLATHALPAANCGPNMLIEPKPIDREETMPEVTRRTLLGASAGIAGLALTPRIVLAQTASAGPFRQDPLPYAVSALEPSIDARTMEIHYGKHHAAYKIGRASC